MQYSHTLLSLKALCLDRTGKDEEAVQLCRQLLADGIHEDHVLSTVSIVFKAHKCDSEMTKMYEYASSKVWHYCFDCWQFRNLLLTCPHFAGSKQ